MRGRPQRSRGISTAGTSNGSVMSPPRTASVRRGRHLGKWRRPRRWGAESPGCGLMRPVVRAVQVPSAIRVLARPPDTGLRVLPSAHPADACGVGEGVGLFGVAVAADVAGGDADDVAGPVGDGGAGGAVFGAADVFDGQ